MNIGISTGCFFPEKTDVALCKVAKLGAKYAEIFFNTDSELEEEFLYKLKAIADKNAMQIISVHPFTSAIETFYFFSKYDYKLEDAIKMYEKYFRACQILNCKFVVFHGCFTKCSHITMERYTEILNMLGHRAAQYGVYISQENVVEYKCGYLENLKIFHSLAQENIKFTFDIKQAVRANQDIYEILNLVKNRISHVHISDFDGTADSLVPLQGNFDFKSFFSYIQENTSADTALIEVYRDNIDSDEDIAKAMKKLESL
ncbi:MAG: sugar phosphate isomerase/epimerase [Oscillospiraceae bacterium]